MSKIHDLDALLPEKEYVKLSGKKIEVSDVKIGIALELLKKQEKFSKMEKEGTIDDSAFDELLDIVVKVARNPEVDKNWLKENANLVQLTRFIEIVGENISRTVDKKKEDTVKSPAPEKK